MLNTMFNLSFIVLLATLLSTACLVLCKKSWLDQNKMSPFECGFDQKSSSRIPFSLRFFLITIIFLIFDVEIALILPVVSNTLFSTLQSWLTLNLLFIVILIIGILHEWSQGVLEWSL